MNRGASSSTLVTLAPGSAGGATVVCVPFAGGSAQVFAPLASALNGPRVLGVQLPGRASRLREAPHRRLQDVVDEVTTALEAEVDGPFLLFGTSMGGLVAFETTRALRRLGRPLPAALIVAAARAPQSPSRDLRIHDLPTDRLLQALRRYGGTPPQVLAEPDLMDLLLPMIRADFAVTETYVHAEESPLPMPLIAMGGRDDPFVPAADLEGWADHTAADHQQLLFEGGHFFHSDPGPQARLCQLITARMESMEATA
jgi:medium-chain acyl-[acyl-carrier-protein] hydrolase